MSYRAAELLGQIGDERVVNRLLEALRDSDLYYAHSTVASALGKLGGARVVDGLLVLLRDPVVDVRRSAEKVLPTKSARRSTGRAHSVAAGAKRQNIRAIAHPYVGSVVAYASTR